MNENKWIAIGLFTPFIKGVQFETGPQPKKTIICSSPAYPISQSVKAQHRFVPSKVSNLYPSTLKPQ